MKRQQQIKVWLQDRFPDTLFKISPASADASFRQYFRVTFADRTLIVMDAPPQHEDCRPFIHVAKLFNAAGVHVPQVLAQDLEQGFLLLTDLGTATYLQTLNSDNARELYGNATDALINIQQASQECELPPYDSELLMREMQLFQEWYIEKYLDVTLNEQQVVALKTTLQHILKNNLAQPRVFVHRDYHSRNLMISEPGPGILDFQDALYGPITYDLVSLFKDAYIRWEEGEILDWLIRYWEKARRSGLPVHNVFADFFRDYEWMGVQRHLKVAGIFARLHLRDNKSDYLKDLPLVLNYLRCACERYTDLRPLLHILDDLDKRTARP